MKPFRGKPEKPKRSNGEIHRQRRWLPCGVAMSGASVLWHAAAAVCSASSACTSPLVGRRDPLGAGLRPGWSTVASRSRVHAADHGCPAGCPAVYRTHKMVLSRTLMCVLARRQARLARIYGPSAVAGCLVWPLVDDVLGPAIHYQSATLLLWVLSGPVLKHGPRSLTCARVIGI